MRMIIAGSGSGGHLYPALAVAEKIKRRDPESEILLIGAGNEISSEIIEANGYSQTSINARGFNRRNLLKNAAVIKDLAVSSIQIRRIFKDFKPDAVFGAGGYVSGPVIREARRCGLPAFLQEQNVIPGVANKLSEKYADEIFAGFPGCVEYFKEREKITVTGNPLRRAFLTSTAVDHRALLGLDPSESVVFIMSGSLGAGKINDTVCEMLMQFHALQPVTFMFLTGRREYEKVMKVLGDAGLAGLSLGTAKDETIPADINLRVRLIDYTERIHELYSAADLIISRSGAMTVSEIAAIGRPSILIPSPNVTNNHQYHNAKVLSDIDAALLIEEKDLTADKLASDVMKLCSNKGKMNRMSEACGSIARLDAADIIYDHIVRRVGTKP